MRVGTQVKHVGEFIYRYLLTQKLFLLPINTTLTYTSSEVLVPKGTQQ